MVSAIASVKPDRRGLSDFFGSIGDSLSAKWKRFVDGSPGTKLSHLIFGAGNLYNGQIAKGLMFLLLQLAILAFMIFCPSINDTPYGWKALRNLSLSQEMPQAAKQSTLPPRNSSGLCRLVVTEAQKIRT